MDHAAFAARPGVNLPATPAMSNLATRIWTIIEPRLAAKGMELHEVRVYETEDHGAILRKD